MVDANPPTTPQETRNLRADHTPAAVRRRLRRGPQHSYLRDFVYGAIDGAVTTFAVVSGVEGAALPGRIVLILGVANLVADGFSMAASNYLGTRADEDLRQRARSEEEQHIAQIPAGEREEVRQIFAAKGFDGADLDRAVDIITSDRRQWVDTMMREELGLTLEGVNPVRAGLVTFVAFVIVGSVPLLPFAIGRIPHPFAISTALTAIAMFLVGSAKSRVTQKHWLTGGLETLCVGGAAAGLAYLLGHLLRHFGA